MQIVCGVAERAMARLLCYASCILHRTSLCQATPRPSLVLHSTSHIIVPGKRHPRIHARTYTCMHARMHACKHAISMHTRTQTRMRECAHARMHACDHTCTHACTHHAMATKCKATQQWPPNATRHNNGHQMPRDTTMATKCNATQRNTTQRMARRAWMRSVRVEHAYARMLTEKHTHAYVSMGHVQAITH